MCKVSLLVASVILCGFLGSLPASAGTVGYWRMEEGAANAQASGNRGVLDSSGNGNNGTAMNGPVYNANTAIPTIPLTGDADSLSMQFSGTGMPRIVIPDGPEFSVTGSFTIEAYFNVFAIPHAAGTIFFRGDDRTGNDPYFLNVETGLVRFGITDATNHQALVTAPLPGLNQWIYAAGVFNASAGTMNLYINGTLANSLTTSITPLATLDPTQEPGESIGAYPSTRFGDFASFDGLIDEVKFSDTALQPSQFLVSTPEPASGVLCVGAALGILCRRRRA